MPAHCSEDIEPVPESVSRSMRTSSERSANRLCPAARSRSCRSARVSMRIGSTLWMRNGSMMVRQRSVMARDRNGLPGAAVGSDRARRDDVAGVDDRDGHPPAAYVYLLRCADGTLYCGWTVDLEQRVAAHA